MKEVSFRGVEGRKDPVVGFLARVAIPLEVVRGEVAVNGKVGLFRRQGERLADGRTGQDAPARFPGKR